MNEYSKNFKKIEEFLTKDKGWRNLNFFLEAHINFENILANEELSNKFFLFIKSLQRSNFQIEKHTMKLLAILLKYVNKVIREEILKYVLNDISSSKSYFKRRLFFVFLDVAVDQYSSFFLLEVGLIDKALNFLEEKTPGLLLLFRALPKFYFMVSNNSTIKYKIEIKLKQLRQESKDPELVQEAAKLQGFLTFFHNKYIYTNDYDDLVINDKLRSDQELVLFNKETKTVIQANIQAQTTPHKKTIMENVDDIFRKRGKMVPSKKSGKALVSGTKNVEVIKLLHVEKSHKDLRSPKVTKTYIEARDTVKPVVKEKDRRLSSMEHFNLGKEKFMITGQLPSFSGSGNLQYNSNNIKLPLLKKLKK